jgi:LmbE family N-acetylglucosaminyl deacetylase
MTMNDPATALAPILGRTLLLAPHPDDEAAGCGVLLQRIREPHIAFLTDGAPHMRNFWARHGSRHVYAELRRREAEAASAIIELRNVHFCDGVVDQDLFRSLEHAQGWLCAVLAEVRPEALLVPAFEGGHPDHDAASLLGCIAGKIASLPVWEFPLYHRSTDGALVNQQFHALTGGEVVIQPTAEEWDKKLRMFGEYVSQREVLQHFLSETETFRPQAAYDYSAPPHPGVLNYEAWQWGITGGELAAAFSEHLHHQETSAESAR